MTGKVGKEAGRTRKEGYGEPKFGKRKACARASWKIRHVTAGKSKKSIDGRIGGLDRKKEK